MEHTRKLLLHPDVKVTRYPDEAIYHDQNMNYTEWLEQLEGHVCYELAERLSELKDSISDNNIKSPSHYDAGIYDTIPLPHVEGRIVKLGITVPWQKAVKVTVTYRTDAESAMWPSVYVQRVGSDEISCILSARGCYGCNIIDRMYGDYGHADRPYRHTDPNLDLEVFYLLSYYVNMLPYKSSDMDFSDLKQCTYGMKLEDIHKEVRQTVLQKKDQIKKALMGFVKRIDHDVEDFLKDQCE